jgi:excinuclease ABC subunit A
LSLASGAIKGWDRRNAYYFAMLESLAAHYRFDIEQAFESLARSRFGRPCCTALGMQKIRFSYARWIPGQSAGKKLSKKHPFEGIIPNMQRRYRETDSSVVREDLARYRSTQACPDCAGSRLRREASHVKIGEGTRRGIFELSHLTLAECFDYFSTLHMHGCQRRHCGQGGARNQPATALSQ